MSPQVPFPPGRQFALTWSIPDDFGGMTAALLHRSRAIVRLAGQPVDVLTFDTRPDYPEVERELRKRGELIDGMTLVNLWDWLREHEVPQDAPSSLSLDTHLFEPLAADPAFTSTLRDGRELSRARVEGDTTLQVDYYREDGSLLVSDHRGASRSVVLCDREGAPIRSWGSIWGLYRFWLDLLRGGERSFMIVDSKPVATFMASYRRKGAVVVHVVHGSHGNPERAAIFEKLDSYDSVVLLTARQRADVQTEFGRRLNLAVIGNGRDLSAPETVQPRSVQNGIVLASFTTRKRVDHAVRAVARAAAEQPGVSLDVYGDGTERSRIEATIAELGAPVRLHGHVPGAREQLAGASFLLLTSTSEGLPLVLVEAMAAGCIPIAYDIPYGPADVIRDGRNGYLVPAGDAEAMARAIARLLALSPRQVARLRERARRSAERFSDLRIMRLWAKELRLASLRKAAAVTKKRQPE